MLAFLHVWDPVAFWNGSSIDYSPIRDTSYLIDRLAFGRGSAGFHATNVFLHGLNACLLMVFLRKRADSITATVVAIAWAVHPVSVEPVAWISARKDLLMLTGVLLAGLAHQRSARRSSVVAGLSSMLSKYTGVIVPFVLLAFDRVWRRRTDWRVVAPLVAAAAVLGLAVSTANLQTGRLLEPGTLDRWPGSLQVATHALAKILWPSGLNARYAQRLDLAWTDPVILVGAAIAVLFTAALVFALRRAHALAEGLAIVGFGMAPTVLQIAMGHPIWMADRYLYVPLVGVALMLSWIVRRHRAFAVCVAGVAIVLAMVSSRRLDVWQDSLSLWRDTISRSSQLYYVHGKLADAELMRSNVDAAMLHYARALELEPGWHTGRGALARLKAGSGDLSAARALIEDLEATAPDVWLEQTRRDRATTWAILGDLDRATKLFKEHLATNSHDATTWNDYGVTLYRKGEVEAALAAWTSGAVANPGHIGVHLNRARVFAERGDCDSVTRELSGIPTTVDARALRDARGKCP